MSLRTSDRNKLIRRLLDLVPVRAHISFEGDLSKLALADISGASEVETNVLKRNTDWPRQDFLIIPRGELESSEIMRALGGTIPSSVIHVQIEVDGIVAFSAFDNFQHTGFADEQPYASQLLLEGLIKK